MPESDSGEKRIGRKCLTWKVFWGVAQLVRVPDCRKIAIIENPEFLGVFAFLGFSTDTQRHLFAGVTGCQRFYPDLPSFT